ncbi:sensor histidine kinase [Oceanirhabdus sp. W0125-5]|uniref:sensor histidine kinase n=1 Tax=Oceanirhabdus sp. W0125-5 TaxID=2999116 RepID=UPI0022F2F399|nr:sensor histidine kinase [Oceanirhabdus sp. W0125-5]WBW98120.1 sensor histidine kinase [Oceanirhabdus sp. W0125-5]
MSFSDFLKDKVPTILLNIICSFALISFLMNAGIGVYSLFVILISWYTILIVFCIIEYIRRKKYFDELLKIAKDLEQRYLISEIIDEPKYSDGLPYYALLKMANKSMIEEITKIKNERKEYKEYIEQWVHEIKTPISSIKLIGENNKSHVTREVLSELENIDNFVEQALFYARSEHVEKDYLIKEISLKKCVNSVIVANKHMFIQNRVQVELSNLEKTVYSDSKWIEFIINQLLINSVKYRSHSLPKIKIFAEEIKGGVSLVIEDNGIGIAESELPRVFEKGFTGSSGRNNNKSTGIGLYLCKKLCDKLGLIINITSKENEYTKVSISFPKGTLVKI